MKRSNLIDILDACERKLEAGVPLEEILTEYPEERDELRELLLAAQVAAQGASPNARRVPASAQIDSRRRFLARADELIELSQKQPGMLLRLRRLLQEHFASAAIVLISALLLFIALRSTWALPATGALPANTITPQTGAEQTETAIPASRLRAQLEESILQDQQAVEDVRGRIAANGSGEVQFSGFLKQEGKDQWTAANIPVVIAEALIPQANQLRGEYTQVNGQLADGKVLAQELQTRLYDLEGTLERMENDHWVVEGLTVVLNSRTGISGSPRVGEPVTLQVSPVESQPDPIAVQIQGNTEPPVATTLQPTLSPETEPTLRPSATPQPSPSETETEEAEEPDEHDKDKNENDDDDD